jgi:hypothetical protein
MPAACTMQHTPCCLCFLYIALRSMTEGDDSTTAKGTAHCMVAPTIQPIMGLWAIVSLHFVQWLSQGRMVMFLCFTGGLQSVYAAQQHSRRLAGACDLEGQSRQPRSPSTPRSSSGRGSVSMRSNHSGWKCQSCCCFSCQRSSSSIAAATVASADSHAPHCWCRQRQCWQQQQQQQLSKFRPAVHEISG